MSIQSPGHVPEPVSITDVDGPAGTALLGLNNAHAVELSWLTPERLRHLVAQAFLARRIGTADALLLAFDQDAGYDSPNFLWFRARLPRFVYVDRVVVAPAARRQGCARALYDDLFRHAAAGHGPVVCEVNATPPNPASDAFHHALGFQPVATAALPGTGKTVRYMMRQSVQNGSSTSSNCCP